MKSCKKNKIRKVLAATIAAAMTIAPTVPAFAADNSAQQVSSVASVSTKATTPYVKSDTTMDFTVTQGQTYAFRFEVIGTHANPSIAAGNGSVLRTEEVKKVVENGNDVYYFKVRATGQPGQGSGVYTTLPGQKAVKHCTIHVGTPYVKSDTTMDFSVKQGNTYAFRFEVVGPQGLQPNIAAGNGNVLRTEEVKKVVEKGNDVYYFKVRAIGKSGEGTGVYTTLPGQSAVKHCTIWVDNQPKPTQPDNPGGGTSTKVPLQSISLNQTSVTLEKGKTTTLSVAYNPSNTTDNKAVTWSSSNTNIATVSNGVITAKAKGTAAITATVNGKTASCSVFVNETGAEIPLQSISLSQTACTLQVDNQQSLSVTYNPSNTTDSKSVTWISSNPSVATVNASGVVTAFAAGTATITAKVGSKTATCTVTVQAKPAQGTLGTITASWPERDTTAARYTEIKFTVENAKTDGVTFTADSGLSIIRTEKESKSSTETEYTVTVLADRSGTYNLVGHADNTTTVKVNVERLTITSPDGQNVTIDTRDTQTITYMLNASGGNITVNTDPSFLTSNAEIVATSKKQANNKSDCWTVIVRPASNASSGTLTMQLGDASYTTHLTYVDTQKKAADAFIQYAAQHNYTVTYDPTCAAPQLLGYATSKADVDATGMPDENSMYNLLEKMKDHGATKFAYTISPKESYTGDYFTYQVTRTVPAGTEPEWDSIYYSVKNTDFDNTDPQDCKKDKIGCNPYACRRLQEVTGINIGEIDIGAILNGQEYSRPWSAVKSYYESLGMKFGKTPKKHSIVFFLAGNTNQTHVTHVAFVESDVFGISDTSPAGYYLSTGGNANPLMPGYYKANELAAESDSVWYLYTE